MIKSDLKTYCMSLLFDPYWEYILLDNQDWLTLLIVHTKSSLVWVCLSKFDLYIKTLQWIIAREKLLGLMLLYL
jgi:hypothetical protein